MKKYLYLSFFLSCLFITSTNAQIVPDNTLGDENSVVTPLDSQGSPIDFIEGGATRGANLFHSFQEFNVNTGRGAYFNNPTGIENILSRVTGNNISNINGVLGVFGGSANLFLINPNGIIFGNNASLDLGGSFFASTADSLLFDNDFEFSASNPTAPSLLTVNIPIGINFREQPGDIVNNSVANGVGLSVAEGKNISLVGGNVSFDGGTIFASGANVQLGGLTEAGTVNINEDSSLTFPDGVARGDVFLANNSLTAVSDRGGGSININARNFELTSGSNIIAAITSSDSLDTQAGDIVINATNNVLLNEASFIANFLGDNALGKTGNIDITARNISFLNGGNVFNVSNGRGDTGNITLTASADILFDGIELGIRSGVQNFLNNPEATGNVGDINLESNNLSVTNGGQILSLVTGVANGGNINLDIANSINIDGFGEIISSDGTLSLLASQISSQVAFSGVGDSGDINLNTQNLSITNNGELNVSIAGLGNGGDININADTVLVDGGILADELGNTILPPSSIGTVTLGGLSDFNPNNIEANAGNIGISTNSLVISNGGAIDAGVSSIGNGGNIVLNATEFVEVSNGTVEANVISQGIGEGNGGSLEINTARLFLTDEALISASVLGTGNAGNLVLNATDFIDISNSSVIANIFLDGVGDAGGLEINTTKLSLTDGAFITASVSGTGNAGSIIINVLDTVEVTDNSLISVNILENAIGNSGNIEINTANLSLMGGSVLTGSSRGQGNAGSIVITATDKVFLENSLINSNIGNPDGIAAVGNVGNIQIEAREIEFTDTAQIQAGLFSGATGEPGIVSLTATESISLRGENTGIFSNNDPNSFGDASNTQLFAQTITFDDGAGIRATNFGNGNGGNVSITANNLSLNRNNSISGSTVSGTGGIVDLKITENLILRSENQISARAFNDANGGNLTIDTEFIIAFPNGNNDIFANAERGEGGNINITAESLFGIQERALNSVTNDINASSEFGLQGNITINTPEVDPTSGLIELPQAVTDPSDQISQNPCEQTIGSEFIITGKGGIPPSPHNNLSSDVVRVDLAEVIPTESQGNVGANTIRPNSIRQNGVSPNDNFPEATENDEDEIPEEIVVAQGWIFNDQGEVMLTAYDPTQTGVKLRSCTKKS